MNTNTSTKPRAAVARLYFGRDIPSPRIQQELGQQTVDSHLFRAFLDRHVAPVLAGWTIIEATGGWRDATTRELVRETSTILETFSTDIDKSRETLRGIAERYAFLFGQDAVAYVEIPLAREPEYIGPKD